MYFYCGKYPHVSYVTKLAYQQLRNTFMMLPYFYIYAEVLVDYSHKANVRISCYKTISVTKRTKQALLVLWVTFLVRILGERRFLWDDQWYSASLSSHVLLTITTYMYVPQGTIRTLFFYNVCIIIFWEISINNHHNRSHVPDELFHVRQTEEYINPILYTCAWYVTEIGSFRLSCILHHAPIPPTYLSPPQAEFKLNSL